MKEIYGDAWELFYSGQFDVLFITTNGTVKKDGTAVMGRGIAAQAKSKYPSIPVKLGELLSEFGNEPYTVKIIKDPKKEVMFIQTFPVKHEWHEPADIELIKKSCEYVMRLYRGSDFTDWKFLLPRPGCGNGGLNWEEVKKVIEPLLDDRFYIVHFKEDN